MGYGLISGVDASVLERSLIFTAGFFPDVPALRILEVGICHGDTSRALKAFLDSQSIAFEYHGIDSGRDRDVPVPFEGATVHVGDSAELWPGIEGPFHWIFLDGCHCANHVALDFLHYGDKVPLGGSVIFHDAAPKSQGKCDYQGHGPREHHQFGTCVRDTARKLGLLSEHRRPDWFLEADERDESLDSAGVLWVRRIM